VLVGAGTLVAAVTMIATMVPACRATVILTPLRQ
jgi:hypothetical protein